jgi:hypothetical protein
MVEPWQALTGLGLAVLTGIGILSIARKPAVGPGTMPAISKGYVQLSKQPGPLPVWQLNYADNRTDPPHLGELLISTDAKLCQHNPSIFNPPEAIRHGLLALVQSGEISMTQYNNAVSFIKSQFSSWFP